MIIRSDDVPTPIPLIDSAHPEGWAEGKVHIWPGDMTPIPHTQTTEYSATRLV